jgi:uncharacterized membrane protein
MKLRIRYLWDALTTTLWFVPAFMMLVSVALALGMMQLDRQLPGSPDGIGLVYGGTADGAREVLAVIAGSMVSVAALTFSITTVTLTVASQQYGSRLLRNFMRDTGTQVVLGTFVGTFTYSLLVLRWVYGSDAATELVPHLSVTVGVALAVVSLGVLIYYIHHVASTIQAGTIASGVAHDLKHAIETLYPERLVEAPPEPVCRLEDVLPPDFEERSDPVAAETSGYVQIIDQDALVQAASAADLLFLMKCRPGHFVVEGGPLLLAWPRERLTPKCESSVRAAVELGNASTPVQDVEHGVEQLVQIAVRALSPAVNDPFTASVCVDRLGETLNRLAGRNIPSPFRADRQGKVRVIAWGVAFPQVADAALHQIRQNSRGIPAVKIRLLEAIRNAAQAVHRKEDREALFRHAMMIGEDTAQLHEEHDRRSVEEALREALEVLNRAH